MDNNDELVIPLAGFVAAEGRFRLDVMIAAASFGSLAGATFWYAVGRRIGEQQLRQWIAVHGKWGRARSSRYRSRAELVQTRWRRIRVLVNGYE
jgi:membrane protein DedA with SNARE-associated domain